MHGYAIPQSTAQRFAFQAFLSSDGKTPATGKTIPVTISKNGGAFANPAAGAINATEIANGWYFVDLGTGDTNTLGDLIIRGTEGTIEPVGFLRRVVNANNGGFAALPNAAAEAAGGLYTRGTGAGQINQPANGRVDTNIVAMAANVLTATAIATGAFTAAKFAAGAFDAVWSVAARLLTAGTNIVLAKGIGVTGLNDLDAAGIRGAVGLANADLDARLDALPTAAENTNAIWDEPIGAHAATGSTGEALAAAGSAGDPWVTALPGAYGPGSAGKIVGDNLNAAVSSRASQATADAVEADTQDIQSRLPAVLVSGRMDSSVGAMAANVLTAAAIATGALTAAKFAAGAFDAVWSVASRLLTAGTNIVLAKGTGLTGLNDLSAAQVNAEVVDALNVDTYPEPGVGTPPATASIVAKIGYQYKGWRNKKDQSATTNRLYADNGTSVDQKADVTEVGGVVTVGKKVSGP